MPKEVNNKKQSKDKKHFMKDFKAELKRVVWPTPKQLFNNTLAVITIVLITAIIVFALDFTFEKMNTYGIEKIKSVVDNNVDTNTTENTAEETNTSEETTNNTVENSDANQNNAVNE